VDLKIQEIESLNYKIWGFNFYNKDKREKEFLEDMARL
jgi:hypothetical protein